MKLMKITLALLFVCTLSLAILPSQAQAAAPSANIVVIQEYPSNLDFASVRSKALEFIKSKGLTLFAEFDHAENAAGVKLKLNLTTVLVFGSPQVGTKLMQEFPGIGMVLPLKILISQDDNGKVMLSYEDLATTFAPYGVKMDNPILNKMQGLLKALAETATK